MNNYRINDLMQICNEKAKDLGITENNFGLIQSINGDTIEFKTHKTINLKKEDVLPIELTSHLTANIKINSKYSASTVIDEFKGKPVRSRPSFSQFIESKEISDLIKKQSIKYVHELQHFINDSNHFQGIYQFAMDPSYLNRLAKESTY